MDFFLRFVAEAMPSAKKDEKRQLRHLSAGRQQQGVDSSAHHRFSTEVNHYPCRRIYDIGRCEESEEVDRPAQNVWVSVVTDKWLKGIAFQEMA